MSKTHPIPKKLNSVEWEARFEPNSHGFRPGRSCHDVIEKNKLNYQPVSFITFEDSKVSIVIFN